MLGTFLAFCFLAQPLSAVEDDRKSDQREGPVTTPAQRVTPVVPLDPGAYPDEMPVRSTETDREETAGDASIELAAPALQAAGSRIDENEPDDSPPANNGRLLTRPIREVVIEPEQQESDESANESTEADRSVQDEQELVQSEEPNRTEFNAAARITGEVEETEARNERIPLTDQQQRLAASIAETLVFYQNRPENVARRSPWGVMHAMIGFEINTVVIAEDKYVNALGWLCWNGRCAGQRMMGVNRGRLVMRVGPGLQGHEGQFLALLAQCGVRSDNELRIGNQRFTVADLVEYEQRTCKAGEELTFKLIGLSYYLDSDAEWTTPDGETWSIERLIQEELKQPVIGAACGGTHRMMGYSFAIRQRVLDEKPIDGQWSRAATFVGDFVDYTFQLQNPDGSFSTNWFEGREARNDIDRRLQTSGHILEWLVYTLPSDQLNDPRIVKAVEHVNHLLTEGRQRRWEVGPKGHALRGLLLYQRRCLGLPDGQLASDAR